MLTPEQSRAYEALSVEMTNEKGYYRTSVGSIGACSQRDNQSCNLQDSELQTFDFGDIPEEVRCGLQRES